MAQMGATIGLMLLAFLVATYIVSKVAKVWLVLPVAATGLVLLFVPEKTSAHQVALSIFCGMGVVLLNRTIYAHISPRK